MTGFLIFILAILSAGFLWSLMKGRVLARQAAAKVCQSHGLQILDDTVSFSRVRLDGLKLPVYEYHFDFTDDRFSRRQGEVQIRANQFKSCSLFLEQGRIIEGDPD